jgi:hypothetical protein
MKNLYRSLLILAPVAITLSCTEEPEPIQKKVGIDFTIFSDDQLVQDLPPDSRLLVNIQSPDGGDVMDYKEVTFSSTAHGYSTAPLDLGFGNYTISDFIIVNGDDDILYAAPHTGGSLETAVASPLAVSFSIEQPDASTPLSLRLVDVRKHKPSDFGFDSFKRPGKRINVVVSLQDYPKPVSADAFLLNGSDTISHYKLGPRVNAVRLPAKIHDDTRLVITRDGYVGADYKIADLDLSRESTLKVVLAPAFTFLAHVDQSASLTFDFALGGPDGSTVSVDWGDGAEAESFQLTPYQVNLTHDYASAGNHRVTITGDLDKVISFYSFYGQGMMDAVNFDHLTALEEIRFGLTRSPKVIDLRQNKNLKFALLSGLSDMQSLLLPKDHMISEISLEGPSRLSTKAIDAVIKNIYDNAVKKNIMNGSMGLSASWYQEEGDLSMVGPPSAAGHAMLSQLRNDYGWSVSPSGNL